MKYRFLVRWLEIRKKTCKKLTHRHCSLNQKTGFNESQEPVRRAHLKKPLSSTGLAVAEAARRRTRLKIFVETEGDIVQTDLCWTAMRTPPSRPFISWNMLHCAIFCKQSTGVGREPHQMIDTCKQS